MKQTLSVLQAYKAMFQFIDDYYNRLGRPVEIGNLLSDMQLIKDEQPADPAAWDDWLEAINNVLPEDNTQN